MQLYVRILYYAHNITQNMRNMHKILTVFLQRDTSITYCYTNELTGVLSWAE